MIAVSFTVVCLYAAPVAALALLWAVATHAQHHTETDIERLNEWRRRG